MNPLLFIRRFVFEMSQSAFADAVGVNQSTVSRWENDELQPSLDEMSRIRERGAKFRNDWSDTWFFETPKIAADVNIPDHRHQKNADSTLSDSTLSLPDAAE